MDRVEEITRERDERLTLEESATLARKYTEALEVLKSIEGGGESRADKERHARFFLAAQESTFIGFKAGEPAARRAADSQPASLASRKSFRAYMDLGLREADEHRER